MNYVCSVQEAVRERKLCDRIAGLVKNNAHPMMQDDGAPANISMESEMLLWPFHHLWLFRAHEHPQKDVNFKFSRHVRPRGNGSRRPNGGSLQCG